MVTSTATLGLLREAIRARRQVRFMANGNEREFSPHVLGTKDGSWRVFGWQSAGGSGTKLKAGGDWRCFALEGDWRCFALEGDWRCFALEKVTALRLTDQPWSIGDPTSEYGLSCIALIDTTADLEYASKSLQRTKRRPHQV